MFFLDTLTHYRRGIAMRSANEALADVVKAVRATGKAGELTVKLKINPSKTGDNEIGVQADVTMKAPKATIPAAVFFADDDGSLHRVDPKQMDAFSEEERTTGAIPLDKVRFGKLEGDTAANG